eukprot:COSAG02_NODE_498_length_21087_cov_33.272394_10_plen_102_part_00
MVRAFHLQDKSGELDSSELATLYKQARGEKLSARQLKAAMACMDADKSGTIEFSEFEAWSVLTAVVHSAVCFGRIPNDRETSSYGCMAQVALKWRRSGSTA